LTADAAPPTTHAATADRAAAAAAIDGVRLGRICIVMMSAVGDAVHVLPVITALKRHAPASRITWVLQPGPASLVRGHPGVDEIVVFDPKRGWRAFAEVRRELRARAFDLVLDFQVAFKAGLVTLLARAPVKLGFDRARARDLNWLFTNRRIPAREPQHVQDQYFEFLDALGVPYEPIAWDLGPWPHERAWQREFFATRVDRPAAAIVVASSRVERDWFPERWAEVVDALHERHGLRSILVGGRSPRELDAERIIVERATHAPVSTLGESFRNLVGILDGCELVFTPNTGPMHIAVALDRPVVTLMGGLDPFRTGPYRRFHDLMIDVYHEPGERSPVSAAWRPGRMDTITVEDVMARVALWEARYRARAGGRR